MMQPQQLITLNKKVNTWIIYFSISKIGLGMLTCYILGNLCYTQCLLFVFRTCNISYVFLDITSKTIIRVWLSDNLSVTTNSECKRKETWTSENMKKSLPRKRFLIIRLFCTKSNIRTIKQKLGFIKRWNEWFVCSIFYPAFILFCKCSKPGLYFTNRLASDILNFLQAKWKAVQRSLLNI